LEAAVLFTNFSFRPEWSMEEATPDYAKPKATAIAPTALIYERNPKPASIN
jgi:hypothetical protein